jgi:Ion channel
MNGRPSSTAARRVDGGRRVREDSRLGRLRASHSYGFVLAFVLTAFLFALVAPDEPWAGSFLVLLLSATLVCALWTSGLAQVMARASAPIVLLGLVVAIVNILDEGRPVGGTLWILAFLLTAGIVVVIGLGVLDQGEVNKQSVRGAVAVYLLLGLLFTFLYGAVAVIDSSPFFAQGTDGTRAIRAYFSYVTLATLGYGDYTTTGTLGHTLAIVEALAGQLYLVTVVALLVARLGSRRGSGFQSSRRDDAAAGPGRDTGR